MEEYKYYHEQTVGWGDMDPFNHVNNVIFFRYFESARIGYLQNVGWWQRLLDQNVGIIVARQSCRYRRQVRFPDVLKIGVRIQDLRSERFTIAYGAYSQKDGELVAEAESLMVSFDLKNQQKAPLPKSLTDLVREFEKIPNE